jgi:deoxyribodipyrimidine photo-lyase
MTDRPIIVWFRRDLRVADNPALLRAAGSGAPVVPVYVVDWELADRWRPGAAGRWWLERSLEGLSASLAALGAPLVTVKGPAEEAIPALARTIGATQVVWNRLYEPYSRDLDLQVVAALRKDDVAGRSFNAGLLFEPEGHVSQAGRPYAQFTAYWRSCLALPDPEPSLSKPDRLRGFEGGALSSGAAAVASRTPGGDAIEESGWAPEAAQEAPWRPGEAGAGLRLEKFLEECVAGYDSSRDIPGVEGTSRLSPHLHFGEIGPRQVWDAVRRLEAEQSRGWRTGLPMEDVTEGAESYVRQLGWREFAHHILFHFPRVPEEPFRPEFARFPWQDDPAGLAAWQEGSTGFPLVDAGMRQLLAEGWMHNRVRMVTASFLTKDLLIPWQDGAAWFWERLVDADLANNTLGWQWTAGSGPDAAPYFRVFNPVLQAGRYDPEGAYTRRWRGAPADATPILDHGEARARALAAFHGLRARGSNT